MYSIDCTLLPRVTLGNFFLLQAVQYDWGKREVNIADSVYDTEMFVGISVCVGSNHLNRTNLQKYPLQVAVNVHIIHQILVFRVLVIKSS